MIIIHVRSVIIGFFRRIKILIIIHYKLVDLIEVVRIKIVTLAEVSFCRFGKELRFIRVSLGGFRAKSQSRIIALALGLKKFFILRQDSIWLVSKLMSLQNFFPTSLWFYPKVILNSLLQLINTCLYQRIMCLKVLPPKSTFLLN